MVGMDAGSSGNILASLVQMKKHIRTFLTKENLSQLKLVDPIQLMEGVAVEGHVNPVHPPDELYDKLASQLTIVLEGDGKPSLEAGQEPDPKRIRLLSYGTVRGGARVGSAQRGGWRGATGAAATAAGKGSTEQRYVSVFGGGMCPGCRSRVGTNLAHFPPPQIKRAN